MAGVLKVMPWLSLVGVVFGAFFVPAGLVLYWMFSLPNKRSRRGFKSTA